MPTTAATALGRRRVRAEAGGREGVPGGAVFDAQASSPPLLLLGEVLSVLASL